MIKISIEKTQPQTISNLRLTKSLPHYQSWNAMYRNPQNTKISKVTLYRNWKRCPSRLRYKNKRFNQATCRVSERRTATSPTLRNQTDNKLRYKKIKLKNHTAPKLQHGFQMKIRGLFHKLLKSKYNSHFHYYCIIKSCSCNVSKKGYMACKNQRCSNPLPRRGGKQAASEQCQTSSCSSLQRSSGGSGKQDTMPDTPPE